VVLSLHSPFGDSNRKSRRKLAWAYIFCSLGKHHSPVRIERHPPSGVPKFDGSLFRLASGIAT